MKYPDEAEVADRLLSEVESGKRWNVWQGAELDPDFLGK